MMAERIRIYFNNWADAPLVWSYDLGTQETEERISGYRVEGCLIADGQDVTVPVGDKDRPRVWFEVLGVIRVEVCLGVLHVYGGHGF